MCRRENVSFPKTNKKTFFNLKAAYEAASIAVTNMLLEGRYLQKPIRRLD